MMVIAKKSAQVILISFFFFVGVVWSGSESSSSDDWDSIFSLPMPEPRLVDVGELGGLGEELENRKWLMVGTGYHQIHFQQSADRQKVAEIYSRIDNVYRFLAERSPAGLQIPIKVFLVPDEYAKSRCDRESNAMRTGDRADAQVMLTSLLHEETHLFNYAFLDKVPQGWWAGEYSCQYFQQRALWNGLGKEVKREIVTLLPDGPGCGLREISSLGKKAFNEAISVFYFLEERYGREKMIKLRKLLLEESLKTKGTSLSNSVFEQVYGKSIEILDKEWQRFYGWGSTAAKEDVRLKKRVSYRSEQASVQVIVQEIAKQAKLDYGWAISQSNTDDLVKRYVRNVRMVNKPLEDALKEILEPVDLRYKLEGNIIVLYKK